MRAGARWLSVLWPLLLLGLFAATFRRVIPSEDVEPTSVGCDSLGGALSSGSSAVDIAQLERCVALDPRNAELMSDLGRAYAASKRLDEAERFYRRALTVDPIESDLHLMLGGLLIERGDLEGARREGEAALRWRPNSLAAGRLVSRASATPEPAP